VSRTRRERERERRKSRKRIRKLRREIVVTKKGVEKCGKVGDALI